MTDNQLAQAELKPCPFCGERGMVAATLDDMYRPMCAADGCCALDGYVTRVAAIVAWNTRHRIQHGAQSEPDLATIAYMSGAYDGRKDMEAQLAEAQREIARLRQALEPFAFREMEKDEGLADIQYVWETIYSDRVQDWFSYEDIEAARAALEAKP